MAALPPRTVTLVLVRPSGELLGTLPPFGVEVPWWQEAGPVVRAAREQLGLGVTLLRLLAASEPAPRGGPVTYLAETEDDRLPALGAWDGVLDDHPRRLPWARPGGPARDLAWADRALASRGLARSEPAEQIRSWNLSSLWRLPIPGGSAWLKHVPPFFGHEGAMLRRLAGGPVPQLLAHEGGRILMPEIPGDDLYDADLARLEPMVATLVALQSEWAGRTHELLALGLPDWRPAGLTAAISDVIDRTPELADDDRSILGAWVDDLPRRFAEVAEAGIPETFVHGDFHPGNVRGDDRSLTLLDWGDSGVGHPLLDQAAFLDRIPAEAVAPIRDLWRREWQRHVPGCEPGRAAAALAPIAAARQAVVYRTFLDNIEPSEWPYHAPDPADWLGRAAALLRGPTV